MDKTYNLNGKKKEFEKGTFFDIYGNYFGYDISSSENRLDMLFSSFFIDLKE